MKTLSFSGVLVSDMSCGLRYQQSFKEPAQRMPSITRQAGPVVKRERAAPQAGIARDGVFPLDAAQDRVFQLSRREQLRVADKLLGAYAPAQLLAAQQ